MGLTARHFVVALMAAVLILSIGAAADELSLKGQLLQKLEAYEEEQESRKPRRQTRFPTRKPTLRQQTSSPVASKEMAMAPPENITEPLLTEAPATVSPTSEVVPQENNTEPLVTEAPVTEPPTSEPVPLENKTEPLVTEAPVTEAPAGSPTTEPISPENKAELVITEAPVAESAPIEPVNATESPGIPPNNETELPPVPPSNGTELPAVPRLVNDTKLARVPYTNETELPVDAPSNETSSGANATESPAVPVTEAPQVTESPTESLKEALLNANGVTNSPTVQPTTEATNAPTTPPTSPETSAPTSQETEPPTTEETPSPTATLKDALLDANGVTKSPTEAPTNAEPIPIIAEPSTNGTTASPTSENASVAPTASPKIETTEAPSAASEPVVNATSPIIEFALDTDSPTASPATEAPTANRSVPVDANVTHPVVIETALDTDSPTTSVTESPTPAVEQVIPHNTSASASSSNSSGEGDNSNFSSVAYSNFILGLSTQSAVPGDMNWTSLAKGQLAATKAAGVTSRSVALEALLALQRVCSTSAAKNVTAEEVLAAAAEINKEALPALKDTKQKCDFLLKLRDADDDKVLREKLEFASASSAIAIRAQEHLYDVSQRIAEAIAANSSLLAERCSTLVTQRLNHFSQYDTQTESADVSTANIVLAALGLALGLILLVLHPMPKYWGTAIGFVISSSFAWAYIAFAAAWYGFELDQPDAWIASTWWRNYYSTYLLGLAGWLLLMCLSSMLYMIMIRNRWFLGIWAGFAIGIIFGVQVNTIGAWKLGYDYFPPWFLQVCSAAVGAALWMFILSIVGCTSLSSGVIQHLCMVFIGSYLFVKSIGVLVGNYPNEFDMAPPATWQTLVYIICMWVLTILVYVFQVFLYGIREPRAEQPEERPTTVSKSERNPRHSQASTLTAYSGVDDEAGVPIVSPVGSAADSRNQSRQQEVSEFGGVRALRPDSENRRLYV